MRGDTGHLLSQTELPEYRRYICCNAGNCEKSNVDDECCRAIAYYLKQINHLMISHSPITDKGGFLLAQEIPNLKTLHLSKWGWI